MNAQSENSNRLNPAEMQFQYNSDFPDQEEAANPWTFPSADPNPCARITTRIYHPSRQVVSTVQNVLVKTLRPRRSMQEDMDVDNDASSSSSSSSSDDDNIDDDMDDSVASSGPQRAYWMQRTIREAIYGRVVYGIVLRRRPMEQGAEWEVTQEPCAIKEMSWQHIRRERNRLAEDPIQEVAAMQYLKQYHAQDMVKTNIMMPLDLLSDDRYLYSIMPYCDGGELFDRLDMNEKFTEEEARYWMHQVLNGIENLQKAGVCHRDMSLENLLVHQNSALIIDMGMCLRVPYLEDNNSTRSLTNMVNNMSLAESSSKIRQMISPQGICGKWIYMSPEIYGNKQFDGFAVDMWAAGVILFLMLTGFPPWEQAAPTDERFRYMTAGYLVQMLTEWELGLSSDAMDLLQRMMWLDPKDRLSLSQVRAHPWMSNGRQVVQSQDHNTSEF